MNLRRKLFSSLAASLCVSAAHSATIYSQDFTASNPIDGSGTPEEILNNTLYVSSGQTITGGSSEAQATNGDYTIALGRNSAVDDGYIFNADPSYVPAGQNGGASGTFAPGTGFAGIDQNYVITTGSITIDDQGTSRTGTVSINANAFNVGGEFLSLNLIQIEEDDATGKVTLIIDYDAFGDFDGNENPTITTNFGVSGDLTAYNFFDAAEAANSIGANNGFAEVLSFTLVEGVPEPSSVAFLGLTGLVLLGRRRR
ncbi:PEP-CTERM sorting domain-containing protein [Haloferula chungangensis]|uniref:PEP-CTERM sorting domain-containing protein n=1 Tax=Haloferula chungangensis TaxID=1048331 RepID=A0ABW2LC18_9BACT